MEFRVLVSSCVSPSGHQRLTEVLAKNLQSKRGTACFSEVWSAFEPRVSAPLLLFRWCSWESSRRSWMSSSPRSLSRSRSRSSSRSPDVCPARTSRWATSRGRGGPLACCEVWLCFICVFRWQSELCTTGTTNTSWVWSRRTPASSCPSCSPASTGSPKSTGTRESSSEFQL